MLADDRSAPDDVPSAWNYEFSRLLQHGFRVARDLNVSKPVHNLLWTVLLRLSQPVLLLYQFV